MASLVRASGVAATALLTTATVAAAASPALAGTTHRGVGHAATAVSTTGLVSVRHVILQVAMGGAVIMLLLTIGLLVLGRMSKAAAKPSKVAAKPSKAPAKPKPAPVPVAEPEQRARSSGTTGNPSEISEAIEFDDHPSAAPDPASSGDGEPSWPDFLAPIDEPARAETLDPDDLPESAFPPVALRILGATRDDTMPAQRHQVALGDDQIDIVLAGGSAPDYVRWAPLPYDVPEDGLAFACIGAGDEGCLFVDLGAAPGAVAIGGGTDAATRFAESIVHQLCTNAAADQSISVLIVGSCIPRPYPPNATSVETLLDLPTVGLDRPEHSTDIVFCELRSNDDAFALSRHVSSSRHRVLPVVLGHLPGAAWSFTASGNSPYDGGLTSMDSSFAASLRD